MSPRRIDRDRFLSGSLHGTAAVAALVVVLVFVFLVWESLPAFTSIGPHRFIADASWHPHAQAGQGTFNLLPMLAGTLLTSLGAMLLATPLGVLSAVFCHDYAHPAVSRWYRRVIELMAGIPSVVYGLWGLVVLVPLIARIEPPGASLLAGIVILGTMILPTVALLADSALSAVPHEYRQAAAALGLSRTATAFRVVLPAARSGLATAVILALARAVGETMALLMVCGNVVQWPRSLFDPVRTLSASMALEIGYAGGVHRSALFFCGLVLLAFVAVLTFAAEMIASHRSKHGSA